MPSRYWVPGLGAALVFVSVVAIMLAVLPGPLRPVDYFLSGTAGTLAGSVALFAVVARTSRIRDIFYRRRR
jgi:hypothetical protein